jgi:mannose-1-phosphate guanylyltransferase
MASDGLTAVVLAAGVGSRLDPLTKQLPKPLVPLANKPVMEHILNLLKRHGVKRTVSNLHYLPDKVKNYFGKGTAFGIDMNFVYEAELTGDAGGVRACREYIDDDTFLVVMGDLITDLDLTYVVNQHKEHGALATIALKQVKDVERFGVAVLNNEGFIQGFQEKPARAEAISNLASTGVYVLDKKIFEHVPKEGPVGFGRNLFPYLISKGLPVLGVEIWGYWSDIGTIDQYRSSSLHALEGLIDLQISGDAFKHGWIGHGSEIGENVIIDGAVLLGSNSRIEDDVRIKGYAIIGDDCTVERGAQLQDTIIWPGTVLGAGTCSRASVIGMNCRTVPGSKVLDSAIVEPVIAIGHTEPTPDLLVDPDIAHN